VKLAYWTALDPASRRLGSHAARLLPELARHAEIGVFVDGEAAASRMTGVTLYDGRAEHYRNALADHDACLYDVGPDAAGEWLLGPLRAWPGLVAIHAEDLDAPFRGDTDLRRRVFDRAIGIVAGSDAAAARLRAEHPWTPLALVAAGADPACAAEICFELLRRAQRTGPWLESLLEAAAAEIPGFFPGDRSAPWRGEIDELVRLGVKTGG
jgi:hypothetical protein